MAFLGRWFGSLASAYREMNQATLTGAIDVIVVRQPDGSLRASPFHVRFGKAGILRPRDKIVDITLNGEPVDLKMKLGDAGEAFFVELKDDESTVAPHLCTSPLPAEDAQARMEKGLEEMRTLCDTQHNASQPSGNAQYLSEISTELPPQTESKSTTTTTTTTNSDDSGKETEGAKGPLRVSPGNGPDYDSHSRLSPEECAANKVHASAVPIDSSTSLISSTSFRPTALASDAMAHLSTDGGDESSFGNASSNVPKSKMFRRKRKKSNSKKSPCSTSSLTTSSTTTRVSNPDDTPQTETFGDIFMLEIDPEDGVRNGAVGGQWSSDEEDVESPHSELSMTRGLAPNDNDAGITTTSRSVRTASVGIGDGFDYRLMNHQSAMKLSRSLPQDVAFVASGHVVPSADGVIDDEEAAAPGIAASTSTRSFLVNDIRGKVGFGFTSDNKGGAFSLGQTPVGELHPFSDGDLTPPMGSPINRPFSPQSDSEVMEGSGYVGSKAHRFQNVNWSWGQLPRVSSEYERLQQVVEESQDSTAFETPAQTPVRETSAGDDDKGEALTLGTLDASFLLDQVVPSLPNETTPTNAELKKTPPGLTLEELEQAEPQIKALYLAQPVRNESQSQAIGKVLDRRSETLKDDDAESATGSSLPQSPRPFEYGGGAGSSGFGSDAEGHQTVNRENSHPTSPCCRHHQFLSKQSSDECLCDAERDSCDVDVGSPRPPASSSPDFIGSDSSSPPQSNLNPEILLSLCGGLKENKKMSDECFMLSLITFDEFCENPEGILANPDLVVKVENHYYTWLVAAPVLLSMGAFGRPLPSAAVNVLLKKHQPESVTAPSITESRKKSTGGYTSWFSWGSREEVPSQSSSAPQMTSLPEIPTSPLSPPTVPMDLSKYGGATETENALESAPSEAPTLAPGNDQSSVSEDLAPGGETIKSEMRNSVSFALEEEYEENHRDRYIKSIRLTPEQLAKLPLKEGANDVVFSVTTSYQGTTRAEATIFLWSYDDKLIISDIDGTITRSDVLGQILPYVGKDWSQDGITSLYRHVVENGYRIIYLSARAIGQAGLTRSYLQSIRQESHCLPNGPLLLSPSSLFLAFHREVIEKKPEEFKIGCLKDIARLFPWRDGASTPTLDNEIHKIVNTSNAFTSPGDGENRPFFAGFGNKSNDVVAYRAVGVPLSRIFTVNHRGEICHELLKNYRTSYTSLKDMADHVFPYIFKGEPYLAEESPQKANVLFRVPSRSESEVAPPHASLVTAARLERRGRSYSTLEYESSASSFPSSIPQQKKSLLQQQLQYDQQHPLHQPTDVLSRSRRSGSAAPKCFFYEGEQYSSFAYWREPLVNMDDEISGLAEAMKL